MSKLTKTAWAITAIYLLSLMGTLVFNSTSAFSLRPNEWGDLLSGSFAGLAFIWLIVGYFQQSHELKLNTKALKAQEEELKYQVEETRRLFEQSKRQSDVAENQMSLQQESLSLAYQSSLQPVIVFYNKGQRPWEISNVGKGPALNIITAGGDTEFNWDAENSLLISAISAGNELEMTWIKRQGALVAIYTDALGKEYTTVCVKNRNTITESNLYPDLLPARYQYQLDNKDNKNVYRDRDDHR